MFPTILIFFLYLKMSGKKSRIYEILKLLDLTLNSETNLIR